MRPLYIPNGSIFIFNTILKKVKLLWKRTCRIYNILKLNLLTLMIKQIFRLQRVFKKNYEK